MLLDAKLVNDAQALLRKHVPENQRRAAQADLARLIYRAMRRVEESTVERCRSKLLELMERDPWRLR